MQITEGYIPFLQYQTYYRLVKESDNTPIILLHGGPGSTHNYFELLDPLAKDHPLISYDQLGCGNSYLDHHPELWNLETWMNELDNLIMQLNIKTYHLLGQSWGGMLAIAYTIERKPDGLQSLILSSTLSSSKLWGEEQHRQIRFLSQEEQDAIQEAERNNDWSKEEVVQTIDTFMKRHCCDIQPTDPECLTREKKSGTESYLVAWGPNEFTPTGTLKDFDYTDRLQEITVPTLIISGTDDLCTPRIAKTMYDRIPHARWELFPGCRHMVFAERTEEYMTLIKETLKEIES